MMKLTKMKVSKDTDYTNKNSGYQFLVTFISNQNTTLM
jgi:hypothetical protein